MPAEPKSVTFKGYVTEGQIQLPRFEKFVKEPPDRAEDMYPEQWPSYDNADVEKRIGNVLGPLSLFAPFPHENISEDGPSLELERPVTPIDEEIRVQPTSFDRLVQFIRRRVAAKPDVPHLSTEDQQSLAGILIGEVSGIWPEIRRQIDDPFLSPEENRELNRRIAVHIVTVCEQLFLHYLKKAQVLNSRGIFSGPANMSRLKAQLALDANKFLNILTVRRYIVSDIRGKEDTESVGTDEIVLVPQRPKSGVPKLSHKGLIETSRPKSKIKRFYYHSPEQEARKITANMPNLDTHKLMSLIADLPDRELETPSQESERAPSRISERESKMSGESKEEMSFQKVLLKRSRSLPQFQVGETLLEESGIDENVKDDTLSQYEIELMKKEYNRSKKEMDKVEEEPELDAREYAAQDLKKLVMRSQEDFNTEEDMPPLLQAITRSAKHDGKKAILERQLKELEEKEQKRQQQQNVPLREPTHPQPATVRSRLPNQMEVRTSDIRVSDRVCMSSITIDRYPTVYNDLIDEVDVNTVKELDRNLFLGDEIKEVYKEIMKTVPTTHLELDDDDMVMPAANDVNLSGTLASATLARRRTDRVINPVFLKENKSPPWGDTDPKQWVKTPDNPPKNFQGEDVFAPLLGQITECISRSQSGKTPNMEKVHEVIRNPSKMSQLLSAEGMPSFVQDKMSRTYSSWLQWWRSTITSDDYMKYLSTQETDYMGVVFHFYDSDDEDEDEDTHGVTSSYVAGTYQTHKTSGSRTTHSSKATEQREKEKKLEEMKTQKQEYKEGFWNVNSVVMGGLGKDPVIEDVKIMEKIVEVESENKNLKKPEEEDADSSRTPKSADTSRSAKTLAEKAAARHSAKARENIHSRSSKVTTVTSVSKLDTDRSSTVDGLEPPLTPQDRLEKVWTNLEMPDAQKLDMAIKYSCNEFFIRLNEAIDKWEKVTDLILKRESLLAKLEKFERAASDPNRFFEKGAKGSSVKRLREAQQRSHYYKRIDMLDMDIRAQLKYINDSFRDIITYKGRPYNDKMKWDRIEMLHWLQEERKQNAIKYEALVRQLPLRSASLDPIPMGSLQKVS